MCPVGNVGGITRRLALWAEGLASIFRIRIICGTTSGALPIAWEKAGADAASSPYLGRVGRLSIVPAVAAISHEIRKFTPDIVISMFVWSDFLTCCAKRFCLGKRLAGVPHLIHMAGDPVPALYPSARRSMYRNLVSLSLRSCDGLIAICRHDAEEAKDRFRLRGEKIHVVPIGVDTTFRITKQAVHDPLTFGVVSRLSAEKNVAAIVRAFRGFVEQYKAPVSLKVFGDGSDRQDLMELSKGLGLDGVVEFMGAFQNPYEAFDKIDCLLMYSHTEGTPRSILEAGLRGVPSIARDVGGVREIIQDGLTGFLVRSETQLLSCMLEYAENDRRLLELGRNAGDFVINNHPIASEIQKLHSLIERYVSH